VAAWAWSTTYAVASDDYVVRGGVAFPEREMQWRTGDIFDFRLDMDKPVGQLDVFRHRVA